MSELIQWPTAKYWTSQWNPVIGCKPCSPACENCYAAAWAKRFGQSFEPHATKQKPPRKGVVFCGNMTDLFGEWSDELAFDAPIYYINSAVGYVRKATYLWLTKRVDNMCRTLSEGQVYLKDDSEPEGVDLFPLRDVEMSNHYFGFTAENQERWETRIQQALEMPGWANKWLSLEPLLGPIDLYPVIRENHPDWNFKWVVVGCESGPNRRPCKIEWVESIVGQCLAANVPVFVKQLDIGGKCVTDINKFPAHLQIRQVPWAKKGFL